MLNGASQFVGRPEGELQWQADICRTMVRLGQSAKRSTTVRGQAGRGATVAGRRLPGAVEQKVDFSCLSGFLEDHEQICFWQTHCHTSSVMCMTQEGGAKKLQ
jgi:hypothetical protein